MVKINQFISVIAAKLFSSAGTGFTYTFRRPRTAPKFELRKFDPVGILPQFLN